MISVKSVVNGSTFVARCSVPSAASVLKDLIRSCFNTESTEDAETQSRKERKNHSGNQFNHGWYGWARIKAKAEKRKG